MHRQESSACPATGRRSDQRDQHRHFHQRTDHGGEGDRRGQPEGRNGDGNRQFEVVAGGGERERGGARVVRAISLPMQKLMTNITTK